MSSTSPVASLSCHAMQSRVSRHLEFVMSQVRGCMSIELQVKLVTIRVEL
jgi:hypothetical protein